jgi:hypothetical protein
LSQKFAALVIGRAALRADIERKVQQVLRSTFGYAQDDKLMQTSRLIPST